MRVCVSQEHTVFAQRSRLVPTVILLTVCGTWMSSGNVALKLPQAALSSASQRSPYPYWNGRWCLPSSIKSVFAHARFSVWWSVSLFWATETLYVPRSQICGADMMSGSLGVEASSEGLVWLRGDGLVWLRGEGTLPAVPLDGTWSRITGPGNADMLFSSEDHAPETAQDQEEREMVP